MRVGVSLQECLQMFHEWLERHDLLLLAPRPNSSSSTTTTTSSAFWLATWSDWDLGTMLEAQCIRTCLDKEPYFSQWVDLKQLYMRYYAKKFRSVHRLPLHCVVCVVPCVVPCVVRLKQNNTAE